MEYEFKVIARIGKLSKYPIGSIINFSMKMSEYDAFVAAHPELERYIRLPPAFVFDGKAFVADIQSRQPDGFKEVLSKIAESHPISPLADRYKKNKTIKEVQTREAVNRMKAKVKKEKKNIVFRNKTKFAK